MNRGGAMTREDPSGWQVRWDAARAASLIASGAWANLTMADHAAALVKRSPNRVVAVDGGESFTAAALFAQASKLADAMLRRGLRRGDRISFQLPNWHETMVIDLAATLAGLVVNPIVPIFREAEVGFMTGEMGSRMIFVPAVFRGYDHVGMMSRVLAAAPGPTPEVVVLRGDAGHYTSFEALLASGKEGAQLPEVSPDDVKLALYTSGTTGRAKAVLHSHNTVGVMAEQFRTHMRISERDSLLVSSPVTHISGAILAFQLPWISGARAILLDVWNGSHAAELIREHAITLANGTVPFIADILQASEATGDRMPSLRVFLAGGAGIPQTLAEEAYRRLENCVLFRCYGSTELPTVTLGSMDRADMRLNVSTDGRPVFSDLKIVDPATERVLPAGAEGEIMMRGAQGMLGYLRQEDNLTAFDSDGYFRSGDLGRFVFEDWIEISGRSKDIIIRSGENLSPKEIEDALVAHPDIAMVAIVAKPSARTGEAACAFVVPKPGRVPTLKTIADFLIARGFAKQKIPEHLVIVSALPTTAAGKVQKHILREQVKSMRFET